MRKTLLFLFALCLAVPAFADTGMITMRSSHNVPQTAERLEKLIKEKGLTLFAVVNHQANAEKVGLSLRPTTLVIFGNPKLGTPLMHCKQTVALDLPQKALIWEDAKGRTWLSYNDPHYLARRHEITGCHAVVKKIGGALKGLATGATQP